jgi:hypothetical protein
LSRNDNLNYIGLSYFKTVGGVPKWNNNILFKTGLEI